MENIWEMDLDIEAQGYNNVDEDICALYCLTEEIEGLENVLESLKRDARDLSVRIDTKMECNRALVLEKRAEAERKARKKARKDRKKRDKLIVDDPILGEMEFYSVEQVTDEELVEAFEALAIEEDSVGFDLIADQIGAEKVREKKREEEEVSRRFWEYLRNVNRGERDV